MAFRETCIVRGCTRRPQVKEVYDRPLVYEGGDTDEVCSAHTDRFGGRFPLLDREVFPGEVVYNLEGART